MPSSRPVSKSSPSLERELDLLRSAQRAVDGGEAHKALTILQQYSSEFPEGMLREEYHAMQIVALCAAGNRTSAREAADRFVRARPGSPLSRRVRTACGGLDPRE
jgi:outer membrane protein assembly factor BamD (BamD/ComL family)